MTRYLKSIGRRNTLRIGLALFAAAAAARPARAGPYTGRRRKMPLAILSGTKTHSFTVELAVTTDEQARGLMHRSHLANDSGMLFIYAKSRIITMWMKNTLIPLDMIFIGRAGRIVSIHERAIPGSLKSITSGKPARIVLEVVGGTAARLKIRPGDRVVYGKP